MTSCIFVMSQKAVAQAPPLTIHRLINILSEAELKSTKYFHRGRQRLFIQRCRHLKVSHPLPSNLDNTCWYFADVLQQQLGFLSGAVRSARRSLFTATFYPCWTLSCRCDAVNLLLWGSIKFYSFLYPVHFSLYCAIKLKRAWNKTSERCLLSFVYLNLTRSGNRRSVGSASCRYKTTPSDGFHIFLWTNDAK